MTDPYDDKVDHDDEDLAWFDIFDDLYDPPPSHSDLDTFLWGLMSDESFDWHTFGMEWGEIPDCDDDNEHDYDYDFYYALERLTIP